MSNLIQGDPRKRFGRRHRERGPKTYKYTVDEVAQLSGLTVATLRAYQARGRLDLRSLESVARFLVGRWKGSM